ncbi:hypothetical protein [Terrihalobacillus insolitus]|uniref:hypothetical protein n=1 Tax=Terrihalobacillus insolitus TaxID=2950438 RepID=UPI00234150DE|nr:hypothetical protein [Terrihalobacillus insolitus]MDC3413914.1 hypothetical protein [Terrihalobacillus insolitus]
MEQLSFDFSKRLELGDEVKVVSMKKGLKADIETEIYLSEYGGKKGKLVEIHRNSNPICFEVEFGGKLRNGIFYEHEIEKI